MRGKIIKGIAGFYYVYVEGRGTYECKAKGIFRKDHKKPLVLVLVVAVVLAVGWKLVGKKAAAAVSDNQHELTFTVLFKDQPLEVAEFAETQIGKQLVNNTKLIPAEVTEVSSSFDASEAGYWLYVTVKATATFSGNVWQVGSQEVRVGYEYILKTSEFELTGIISGMEADNG